jgi:hypothetical protein
MSIAKKLLIGYLIASSVVMHLLIACFIFQFGSAMVSGFQMGSEFANASAGNSKNRGIVKDVSILKEGEYSYTGYSIDYQGQTLYTMGSSFETIQVGDEVGVSISKHPYSDIKELVVVVVKNGRDTSKDNSAPK